MANNVYTSPRLYASKYKPKHQEKRTHFEMGMGYVEPHEFGVSRKEFQKLYNEWEQKLKKSGFNDIEYRSPSHTGHFTPFFRENGSTATFQALWDPSKQEYFELATHFDTYMDSKVRWLDPVTLQKRRTSRWFLVFEGQAPVYKTLWRLHIEGVPYRAIAKEFSGVRTKWTRNIQGVPKSLIAPKSVFWAHNHNQRVLDLFWKWMSDRGYEKDPRDEYVSQRKKRSNPE